MPRKERLPRVSLEATEDFIHDFEAVCPPQQKSMVIRALMELFIQKTKMPEQCIEVPTYSDMLKLGLGGIEDDSDS